MAGSVLQLSESAVIRSLRQFGERYFPGRGKEDSKDTSALDPGEETPEPGILGSLPVILQFLIMTFLSPDDICRLGATSKYWRAVVRDPLLWRFFLLRDMPYWASIDHLHMPRLDLLEAPLFSENESLDDAEEEEGGEAAAPKLDYMAEYLKGCPSCRQKWLPSPPPYQAVTSFLQSLLPSPEPRYAMFGAGIEQLDVSLVKRLMNAPDVLPVSGIPQRQINGVGSGISYTFNNQHKFNILTLYSTNRAEREMARLQKQTMSNKLFILEGRDDAGLPIYIPAPQVQQVCQVVDGFIYVANAEPGRDEAESEVAQIRALLSPNWGSTSRPLLVLSCVSREDGETGGNSSLQTGVSRNGTGRRTPCVYVARRLGLSDLPNPWMVQDTVADSLTGLLDGISWLLKCSGVKVYGG